MGRRRLHQIRRQVQCQHVVWPVWLIAFSLLALDAADHLIIWPVWRSMLANADILVSVSFNRIQWNGSLSLFYITVKSELQCERMFANKLNEDESLETESQQLNYIWKSMVNSISSERILMIIRCLWMYYTPSQQDACLNIYSTEL